jgi:DNA-binding SARP family transcriptional activator
MTVSAEPDASSSHLELRLLRGFELRSRDERAEVPTNAQRLLAFLAIKRCPQHRLMIAGTLWADSSEHRAAANLRTALWQARQINRLLVTARGSYLELAPDLTIDFADAVDRARRVLSAPTAGEPFDPAAFSVDDLLPEWYEDWLLFERERLRQLMLHSLEVLCRQLSNVGRYGAAIEAGLAAVAAEPLRESAQRALICAHLGEGNMGEAVRQFDSFAAVLEESLGIKPSDTLRSLVSPCR